MSRIIFSQVFTDFFYYRQQKTFLKIQGSHIASLFTEVCKLAEVGSPSYGPAVNFLKSAGQSSVVKQCESIENELSHVMNQRRSALRNYRKLC